MARMFYARPSSSFGYWRGQGADGPFYLNQGSGYGQSVMGTGQLAPGVGTATGAGKAWTPTLVYLFVFIIAEMILFKCLERALR